MNDIIYTGVNSFTTIFLGNEERIRDDVKSFADAFKGMPYIMFMFGREFPSDEQDEGHGRLHKKMWIVRMMSLSGTCKI